MHALYKPTRECHGYLTRRYNTHASVSLIWSTVSWASVGADFEFASGVLARLRTFTSRPLLPASHRHERTLFDPTSPLTHHRPQQSFRKGYKATFSVVHFRRHNRPLFPSSSSSPSPPSSSSSIPLLSSPTASPKLSSTTSTSLPLSLSPSVQVSAVIVRLALYSPF